jgi:hypothetical protein
MLLLLFARLPDFIYHRSYLSLIISLPFVVMGFLHYSNTK